MWAKERIGKLYDGRWEIIGFEQIRTDSCHDTMYILKNVYNGKIIRLKGQIIRAVEKGKTTISKVQWFRLKKQHLNYKF